VKVLEEAGLLVTRKVGRSRLHYLNPRPHPREPRPVDRQVRRQGERIAADAARRSREGRNNGCADKPSHVYVVYIKAAPERIREALTQSEFTQQYYYASTVESDWTAGSEYEYAIDGQTAIVGEVLEAVPPSRLAMTSTRPFDTVAGRLDLPGDPRRSIGRDIVPSCLHKMPRTAPVSVLWPDSRSTTS
jgi:hypothetical protein